MLIDYNISGKSILFASQDTVNMLYAHGRNLFGKLNGHVLF